jgi:putative transposase
MASPSARGGDVARSRATPFRGLQRPVELARYTSWLLGHRLREAGLLGSMGKVACAYDNALIESFWGPMQIELLERRSWTTPAELVSAMLE